MLTRAPGDQDACGEGANNPDLHFNHGNVRRGAARPRPRPGAHSPRSRGPQVLHFLQEYGKAIESYQRAAALDPSLPAADAADTAKRQAVALASAVSKRVSGLQ